MVWFQCEDCGENLRKPKLPNHFRICSAYKLSCIDCGEMFTQQTVQGHMQCISEAEKYGPKNQATSAQKSQIKEAKPKPHLDIDINVGLSTRPPWFCSLCNTSTTSKQTLLLHADGKKHRNKAKAFHASKNLNEGPKNTDDVSSLPVIDSLEKMRDGIEEVTAPGEDLPRKKAKIKEFDELASNGMADGEVIQSHEVVAESNRKSSDCPQSVQSDHSSDATRNCDKGSSDRKIKWKKMIISALKSNPKRVLKMKKLQKLVTKSLLESGLTETKDEIRRALEEKLTSSSRFNINGKYIHLNQKAKSE